MLGAGLGRIGGGGRKQAQHSNLDPPPTLKLGQRKGVKGSLSPSVLGFSPSGQEPKSPGFL